jgi:hypothetical protein
LHYGLTLRFSTVVEAQQAANRLQEAPEELDPWEALERQFADRNFWILTPSSGPRDSGLRFPASALPNPLPHIHGR